MDSKPRKLARGMGRGLGVLLGCLAMGLSQGQECGSEPCGGKDGGGPAPAVGCTWYGPVCIPDKTNSDGSTVPAVPAVTPPTLPPPAPLPTYITPGTGPMTGLLFETGQLTPDEIVSRHLIETSGVDTRGYLIKTLSTPPGAPPGTDADARKMTKRWENWLTRNGDNWECSTSFNVIAGQQQATARCQRNAQLLNLPVAITAMAVTHDASGGWNWTVAPRQTSLAQYMFDKVLDPSTSDRTMGPVNQMVQTGALATIPMMLYVDTQRGAQSILMQAPRISQMYTAVVQAVYSAGSAAGSTAKSVAQAASEVVAKTYGWGASKKDAWAAWVEKLANTVGGPPGQLGPQMAYAGEGPVAAAIVGDGPDAATRLNLFSINFYPQGGGPGNKLMLLSDLQLDWKFQSLFKRFLELHLEKDQIDTLETFQVRQVVDLLSRDGIQRKIASILSEKLGSTLADTYGKWVGVNSIGFTGLKTCGTTIADRCNFNVQFSVRIFDVYGHLMDVVEISYK